MTQPLRVFDVEASSLCNLRCIFCPRQQLSETGHMTNGTFARFLEAAQLQNGDVVFFCGLGEPLVNPSLLVFVRQLRRRSPGVQCYLATNGLLLNEDVVPALLELGIAGIRVSANGIDRDTYESLHVGASYDRILKNVAYTVNEIEKRKATTTIGITYIRTRENEHLQADIEAFWSNMGIHEFKPLWMHDRAGTVKAKDMTPKDDHPGLAQGQYCQIFALIHFVAWNGKLLPCCQDLERNERTVIGDIHRDSWAQMEMRKHRILRGRQWPAMCRQCTDVLRYAFCETS